jgi:hypothetical protein
MKENLLIIYVVVLEFINTLMDIDMKDYGEMINVMDLGRNFGQMVVVIKENIVMVKNMERVNIYGQMEIFMMENGVKIK